MEKVNVVIPAPSGFCVLCGSKTSLACHRCGDFYCTKKCQLNDWQRHRYICFSIPALVHPMECSAFGVMEVPPMPAVPKIVHEVAVKDVIPAVNNTADANRDETKAELTKKSNESAKPIPPIADGVANGSIEECDKTSNTNETAKSVAIAKPSCSNNNNSSNDSTSKKMDLKFKGPPHVAMPVNGSVVYITGFRSPNRCFIRDAGEAAEKAYLEICEKVNLLGKELPEIQKLRVYGYALAKYNGRFQRVKVIGVRTNQCARLQYLDLGFAKLRNGAEMREISGELLELPCHSLELQLKGVPNYALNDELNGFLSQFEGERFIVNNVGNKQIELVHVETLKSLNIQILDFSSNMQVFGSPTVSYDKKAMPFKAGTQQKNSNNNNLEVKIVSATKELKLESIVKPSQLDTKCAQLVKAMEEKLKRDQPPNSEQEQDKEILCYKLDKESKNSEEKPKENVAFNNVPVESIQTLAFESSKNENDKSEAIANLKNIIAMKTQTNLKPAATVVDSQSPITSKTIDITSFEPLLVAPFEMRRIMIKNREGLDVFIVDNANVSRGIIGAFDSTYARDFSQLHSRLSEFKDSQPYRPILVS
ncbi:uncharacterized protein LOC115771621 isoform X2 [Drosophila novamexicana]|uniref:uncharacterized protein LOC115771621 isoform X2 n=1 Tax=Drosophila novamexicana TaxID=47314 RepID=UPI0011E5EB93|nr:uncharacterized protein LOC115771621 isoform X2 [Drosophila novamexicana]